MTPINGYIQPNGAIYLDAYDGESRYVILANLSRRTGRLRYELFLVDEFCHPIEGGLILSANYLSDAYLETVEHILTGLFSLLPESQYKNTLKEGIFHEVSRLKSEEAILVDVEMHA